MNNNSPFDKIKGYSQIKAELIRIADTLRNTDNYKQFGVTNPGGIILYGHPGVGKTLMATCLAEASGRPVFWCRKNGAADDFSAYLREIFQEAGSHAPSVIILDDADKYAATDDEHTDYVEYVTLQTLIDEYKGKDVFVIATANDIDDFPRSLIRSGRFDYCYNIAEPSLEDSKEVIAYYLRNKSITDGLDINYLAKLMQSKSCAELSGVINEAALNAAFDGKNKIGIEHFVRACLKLIHNINLNKHDKSWYSEPYNETAAYIVCHESGHALVSEIIEPGSVMFVTVYGSNYSAEGGLNNVCFDHKRPA